MDNFSFYNPTRIEFGTGKERLIGEILAQHGIKKVLLAYGSADQRVPLPHGRQFYDAVRKTNAQVEWVEYATEGHGWALPATRYDFWQRVEKFLTRHIGPGGASQ